MVKSTLSASERDFFQLVTRAILANPFSTERKKADLEICGLPPNVSSEELYEHTVKVVKNRLQQFEQSGRNDITLYSGNDRYLVENLYLFYAFYLFSDAFDRLIKDQIEKEDSPCSVVFARDALSLLTGCGFSSQEAARYFALFFQMRRAYYFIRKGLVGRSQSMRTLRQNLWSNVITNDIRLYTQHLWNRMEDFSTLLLGETGTGKGTAAAAIGRSGYIPFNESKGYFAESFTRAFISITLSHYSEQLIESELFGHRKGAFTGAIEAHKGIFSRCSPHGAIFLDEIGEVSLPIQVKLLQVLQERSFSAVGSHEKLRFKGRVIAATNQTLQTLLTGGRFRYDFYYRLCSDIISIPPLCQRLQEDPEEMTDLLEHTIRRILGYSSPELAADIALKIKKHLPSDYQWPGNVRELEQCVRRLLLKGSYEITVTESARTSDLLCEGINSGSMNAQVLLAGYCKLLYDRLGSYEAVARHINLDRRTVKKHIEYWLENST
jgi:DNA-binding NtrC family response regulator